MASANISLACKAAQEALGSSIVDTVPLNQTEVDSNWSQACWEEPSCIITVKTPQDVAKTLRIVQQFQVPFSIRSGGHSPNPGWSSITKPGILIDLSALNTITEIAAGGFFHFSQEYGLAADNVKEFEIVLADGTVATASATQNTDLFWALKGGGPNFGIVTNYVLYTIPVYSIWYEVLAVSNDQAYAVLDAFALWQNTSTYLDTKGTVALIMSLEYITLGFIYSEPSAGRPAAFDAFSSITPLSSVVPATNGTVSSISAIMGATSSITPARHDYRSSASKIDAQLYKDVYDFWMERAANVNAATGANQTFVLQPVPRTLTEASEARGGNPMGIPKEDHQWWTTLVDWYKESDDEMVRNVSIATTDKWQELGEERGSYIDYIYHNDASRDQNPISTYGTDNIAKLKDISAKYDPNQVFQKLQGNGFLLSKV
ncbi:hypothetical protein N0V82_009203 [Gnomoniopsis sp. IMI 355080]|nr:hypothetical protein N0V82_009203 [Gnomoniopsis sp. IMI 355080]